MGDDVTNQVSGSFKRSIANDHGMIACMLQTARFSILSAKHPFKKYVEHN